MNIRIMYQYALVNKRQMNRGFGYIYIYIYIYNEGRVGWKTGKNI